MRTVISPAEMEYCSISQAATIAKVSRPTIYLWIAEGKLKRYSLLGRPALKTSEVQKAAAKNGKPAKKK